ncbi:hypothetical protein, partial [Enterococcus faecium]|uniref:hypothetical protein n=1 Tax=Enterococcus faecium TaxID=1352 RepID=UPI0034E94879
RTLFNNNPELNTLNLNDAKAFHEENFPVLEKAAKLQTLCLDGFKITPAGAKALAKLNLKSLSLAKSTFNDESLMQFIGSKSLKIINLSGHSKVT